MHSVLDKPILKSNLFLQVPKQQQTIELCLSDSITVMNTVPVKLMQVLNNCIGTLSIVYLVAEKQVPIQQPALYSSS